jgi:hypothetical protein
VPTLPPKDPQLEREHDAVQAALLVSLATPWAVHALVVGLSALGARPLGSRAVAIGILLAAVGTGAGFARLASRSAAARPFVRMASGPRRLAAALSASALLALSAGVLLAVTLPVVAYDALAYRLPVIADWLDAGCIAWLVTDDPVRNGYPLGQEAVGAVLAAATGSMRFVALTSFFHVAAGALSIWLFAERIGVRRELARVGAALFVLVPMVILNAPSGYVDASFAGAAVSCVLLLALVFGSPRTDVVLAAAAGMATAHTLSLKGTGVAIVLAASVAVAVALLIAKLGDAKGAVLGLRPRLLTALLFAAPGSFWALRNLVHTGNPLWPVDVRVAGHRLFAGVASMESVLDVLHNTPASLASLSGPNRLLHTWFEWRGPAVDFDDRMAGLGLAWPLVAVPAIAFIAVRLSRRDSAPEHRLALFIAVAATLLAFVIQPMRWWPRYTIWVWGVGAVAIAATAQALLAAGRTRALTATLSVVTGLALVEAAVGLFHANGLATAVGRPGGVGRLADEPRLAPNAASWVDAAFWNNDVAHVSDVCRGAWKPGTDDANLDGVLAQVSPRPRVHVIADDDGNWSDVQKAWKDAGCAELLLLRGSPVLPLAQKDPDVTVEPAVAFDPLYVVRPRRLSRLASRNVTQ